MKKKLKDSTRQGWVMLISWLFLVSPCFSHLPVLIQELPNIRILGLWMTTLDGKGGRSQCSQCSQHQCTTVRLGAARMHSSERSCLFNLSDACWHGKWWRCQEKDSLNESGALLLSHEPVEKWSKESLSCPSVNWVQSGLHNSKFRNCNGKRGRWASTMRAIAQVHLWFVVYAWIYIICYTNLYSSLMYSS